MKSKTYKVPAGAEPKVAFTVTFNSPDGKHNLRVDSYITIDQAVRGIRAFVPNAAGMADDAVVRSLCEHFAVIDFMQGADRRMVTVRFQIPRPKIKG